MEHFFTKKRIISLCAFLWPALLFAQQVEYVDLDTTYVPDKDKYKVSTNRFWDNWFIGAGAGALSYFGDHNRQRTFTKNLAPNFSFYAGKWFSPALGVRVGGGGFKIKGLTQNGAHSTGEVYDASKRLTEQDFNYFHITGDVLVNLNNAFGGFKEDRFYTISPYVGVGWMVTNDKPTEKEVSANAGLFNSFRLGGAVDLTLDIRGAMVNDRFDGEVGGRTHEGALSAQLGLVYKFKKRGWDKSQTMVIKYDEELVKQKMNALAQDNEALRQQLAEAKSQTVTDVKVEKKTLAAPVLLTFPINQSKVSNEARVNLGYLAKVIKEGDPNTIYSITGYADQGTGTPAINERLSQERAEAVYDILVNEFNVPAQQLKVDYKGGVDNMFYNDPRLSRAVITIAQ